MCIRDSTITVTYVVADVSTPVLSVSRLLRLGYATVLAKGSSCLQPGGTPYKWPVLVEGNHFYLCPLHRTRPAGKRTLLISPIRNERSDFWKLDGEILIRAHVKLCMGPLLTHRGERLARPPGTTVTCSADLLHLRHRSSRAVG